MGAWGEGIFENDAVLDWKYELLECKGIEFLADVFEEILNEEYLEADTSSVGLGAAEIIAALQGKPGTEIESRTAYVEDLIEWMDLYRGQGSELKPIALKVVKRIKEDSELRDLWEESSGLEDWLKILNDLEGRLQNYD